MSKKTWLIDAGHGGVTNEGIYTTSPSFDKEDESTWRKCYYHKDKDMAIFEGQFNRQIREKLIDLISKDGNMQWFMLNHGNEDMSLDGRCTKANNYHAQHGDCVFLSLHGNAGGGTGFEIFVHNTKASQTSKDVASQIAEEYIMDYPEIKWRKSNPSELYKTANYSVLRKTNMPAVLMENLFMDTVSDCEKMLDPSFQSQIAATLYAAMKKIDDDTNI